LAREPLPQGLPQELLSAIESGDPLPPIEGHCDLYSLYSSLTALTQEVKLQSRTFKQLSDTLAQLPAAVASILQETTQAFTAAEHSQGTSEQDTGSAIIAELQPGKQQIELLLDLRDRFERGLNSVHEASGGLFTSHRPWWKRWFGRDQVQEQRIQQVVSAL